MLQVTEIPPRVNTPPRPTNVTPDRPARVMTGRRLNRLLKVASARDRALIAADLTQGALQILRPTYAQASALTNVSLGYVTTVSGLTPEERAQLARGLLSLPRLHNRRRRSNAELDRVVEHYGVEAIWRALDRATAPNNG